MYLKKKQNLFILELFLLFIYAILIILGIKEFSIWQQITYYLSTDFDMNNKVLLHLFEESHPHFLRILILYFIYQFSLLLSLDVNLVYSLVLLIFLYITYIFIKNIIIDIYGDVKYSILTILLFYFLLSFFMNGRIIFAIFGNTLLLNAIFFNTYSIKNKINNFKLIFMIVLSLIMTSVSSGTFMVCLLSILIFYFLTTVFSFPFIKKKIFYVEIFIFMLIIFFMPLIIRFINKNLDFYDGSFFKMLEHGFGKYLEVYIYPILIFLFLLPFFLMFGYSLLYNNKYFVLPFSLIISSLFIGLFGYSSLFSGISGYILFVAINFYNTKGLFIVEKNIN